MRCARSRAATAVASAVRRLACASFTEAWYSAGSIWNNGCPAFTISPCSNNRACSTPETCGRTSDSCEATVRPGNSWASASDWVCRVSTVTSGAGPFAFGASLPQAASPNATASPSSGRRQGPDNRPGAGKDGSGSVMGTVFQA